MGYGRNLDDLLTIVLFYLTHQALSRLKRGHIPMALSDRWPAGLHAAITQSIVVHRGKLVPENISPPVLILTHNNADSARVHVRHRLRDFARLSVISSLPPSAAQLAMLCDQQFRRNLATQAANQTSIVRRSESLRGGRKVIAAGAFAMQHCPVGHKGQQ